MNTRRRYALRFTALAIWAIIGLSTLLGTPPAHAQEVTTLIQFTNVWKYDQSGRELGTAWRTNDYDDSTWASGQGLLGVEPNTPNVYARIAPILTPLTLSPAITTYYFRTTFVIENPLEHVELFATNLVDDGCVIYLNGMLAGGIRAPATFNATTLFPQPATEGQFDVAPLTNFLRDGINQLAVEVHQASATSSDLMFGMCLIAVRHTPLARKNHSGLNEGAGSASDRL